MKVGLRIDVDTYRGTKRGVPNLCKLLASKSILATFYFCVGPDNMGRHLWHLYKPSFLLKMLRSKAPGLYGWGIFFRGTFWPGPIIGRKLASIIKETEKAGHEIGLHAWDHHYWQTSIDSMDQAVTLYAIAQGVAMFESIMGKSPVTSAVPGWKCNNFVLLEKSKFPFKFNSDCRGTDIFLPVVGEKTLTQPQIPVNLPTYDEVIGRNGISDSNYNDYILSLIKPDVMNVLTIHAEVEGIAKLRLFSDFIVKLSEKHGSLVPLGSLLPENEITRKSAILRTDIPGRADWVAMQAK